MYCRIEKMASISRRIDVEKFSSVNFVMWKLKMKDLFTNLDLWDVIDKKKPRPKNLTLAT